MRRPQAGEIYQHFKGMLYQVMAVAIHSETREELVIYQALYGDYKVFARPLAMFLSEVDREKYPDVSVTYRFTKVERDEAGGLCPPLKVEQVRPEDREKKPEETKAEETKAEEKQGARIQDTKTETSQVMEKQAEEQKEIQIDADLMSFLDARDYAEKLEILYAIRNKVDDQMMTHIEISMDLPVGEGSIDDRISAVKYSLQTMARFETRRLR
ncbi:MAG: DUF1653 domain-containing protein [Lachnospiraceae bacterium]|nr:DUF1653 domain-containing protein [Lachnospiraceae bacterium]